MLYYRIVHDNVLLVAVTLVSRPLNSSELRRVQFQTLSSESVVIILLYFASCHFWQRPKSRLSIPSRLDVRTFIYTHDFRQVAAWQSGRRSVIDVVLEGVCAILASTGLCLYIGAEVFGETGRACEEGGGEMAHVVFVRVAAPSPAFQSSERGRCAGHEGLRLGVCRRPALPLHHRRRLIPRRPAARALTSSRSTRCPREGHRAS